MKRFVAAAALAALVHVHIAVADGPVIFVNTSATGANDGSSWKDAFADLQEALAIAQSGDQIWIAAGTYTPGPPGSPLETTSFHLVSGVALYGGFAGDETELDERDWNKNETILSGLPDSMDGTVGQGTIVHRVLDGEKLGQGTRIDGLIIRDGYVSAQKTSLSIGGGVRLSDSILHISNCRFVDNFAMWEGGAIYATNSDLTIENTRFDSNQAYESGGAVRTSGGSVSLKDCEFAQNVVFSWGGGLSTSDATVVAENTVFQSNHADLRIGSAGAASVDGNSTFTNCTFKNNSAASPSHLYANGSVTLHGCAFEGGVSGTSLEGAGAFTIHDTTISWNTGAIWWSNHGQSTISSSSVTGNGCEEFECTGGVVIFGGSLTVTDSVFAGNWSWAEGNLRLASMVDATLINCRIMGGNAGGDQGGLQFHGSNLKAVNLHVQSNVGGVEVAGSGHATFINATIISNTHADPPAVLIKPTVQAVFKNSIIWGNNCFDYEECQIVGPADVSYSIVQTAVPWPGEGNLNVDPFFADNHGRLSPNSPAIDAGNNAFLPPDITTDLDGNPRIVDGTGDGIAIVDIGAYEFQLAEESCIFADLNCDGVVNQKDLVILVKNFGPCHDPTPGNCPADLNGDGVVDHQDILILVGMITPGAPGGPHGGAGPGGPGQP